MAIKLTVEDIKAASEKLRTFSISAEDKVYIKVHPSMRNVADKAAEDGIVDVVIIDDSFNEISPGIYVKNNGR